LWKSNTMVCTVTLTGPSAIGSVCIADPNAKSPGLEGPAPLAEAQVSAETMAELESQKIALQNTCQIMQAAADKLSKTCQTLFKDHRDQIAQLAVEIARVVLMQKTLDGAYDIEAIVKETLSHAPTQEDVTIRVNPKDLAACSAAQSRETDRAFVGIRFIADDAVGRAECVLESPRGIIQSLLEAHLHKIGEALKKTG